MKKIPLTHYIDVTGLTADFRRLMLKEFAVNGAEHVILSDIHLNYLHEAEDPETLLKEYQQEVADAGLTFVDAHSVFGPEKDLNCPVPELRPKMLEMQKKCLYWSAQCGIKTITIHTGNPRISGYSLDDFHQAAIDSLEKLLPVAEACGITVCIENIWFPTNTPAKLMDMLNHFDSPNLGFCFDSGHANIMAHPTDDPASRAVQGWQAVGLPVEWSSCDLEKMLPHIVNCHLHDNDGILDRHHLPGHGNINWEKVMALLAQAPRLQCIQNEVLYPRYEKNSSIKEVCSTFQKLSQLLETARSKLAL